MKKMMAIVLALLMVLSLAACGAKDNVPNEGYTPSLIQLKDGDTVGDGKTAITVMITGTDGETITVTVNTDEKTVGDALQSIGLIDGEEGEYGLYIKTVNQETVDYETDGAYWAFYIGGEYAATGVDQTAAEAGIDYAFVAEKAE